MGTFRPLCRRSYPRGIGCYCADQNANAPPGGTTPPEGPARRKARGAQGKPAGGESTDLGKACEPSSLGRRETHVTLLHTPT